MSRQKQKGTAFETLICRGFSAHLGIPIDRHVLHGAADEGDILIPHVGGVIVVEAKSRQAMDLAGWVDEATVEAENASKRRDVLAGVVVHKRRGRGAFEDQYATMPMSAFLKIAGLE